MLFEAAASKSYLMHGINAAGICYPGHSSDAKQGLWISHTTPEEATIDAMLVFETRGRYGTLHLPSDTVVEILEELDAVKRPCLLLGPRSPWPLHLLEIFHLLKFVVEFGKYDGYLLEPLPKLIQRPHILQVVA